METVSPKKITQEFERRRAALCIQEKMQALTDASLKVHMAREIHNFAKAAVKEASNTLAVANRLGEAAEAAIANGSVEFSIVVYNGHELERNVQNKSMVAADANQKLIVALSEACDKAKAVEMAVAEEAKIKEEEARFAYILKGFKPVPRVCQSKQGVVSNTISKKRMKKACSCK